MSDMTTEMNVKLAKARELLNAEGPEASRSIRAGAEIVRTLAEREDVLEAWELMLAGHEKGLAPFKTKKFARAAWVNMCDISDFESQELV